MEWWESFFDEGSGEIMFTEEAWQRAEQNCDALIALLGPAPGAKILDLACGPGRFAIPLTHRGFQVVGLDISPVYLEQARTKAKEQGLQIQFIQGDMRNIPFEREFDAVINFFTSFGYFEREEDHLIVLKEVRKSLKLGGRFLLEFQNREWLMRHFQERDWREYQGFMLLEERKLDLERNRIEGHWIVLKGANRKEYTHSLRLFTLAEFLELFAQAGLKVLGYYGGLRQEPLSPETNRLVILAERARQINDREVIAVEEKPIGKVTHFFGRVSVAVLDLSEPLKLGDTIHIKGHTTDLTQHIESMQIEHKDIQEAKPGDQVAIKVTGRVHEHDVVYKVVP